MKYRDKREDETWNWYSMHLFRESKHLSYVEFLKVYFSDPKRLLAYQKGIAEEAAEKIKNKKSKKDTCATRFAKKPDRLKKKKGFLF